MESGTFRCDGWESGPVLIASSFRDRWKGLKPLTGGKGLLLRGGSVHGFGMREPLQVVGLDAGGCVLRSRALLPRGLVVIRGARYMLELPCDRQLPPHGGVLTWVRAGSADPLRNSHRQPE